MAAWFWLIAWGLWWLLVIMGAQGASPVMAVIGLLALPVLFRKRPKLSLDVIVFCVFLAWCIATSFWSDGTRDGLVTIDLANENLAINSPGLRLSLTAAVSLFAYWAILQFSPKTYERGLWVGRVGMTLVFLFFAVALIDWRIITALGDFFSSPESIGQNVIRSTNLLVLSLPVFMLMLGTRKPIVLIPVFVILLAIVICLSMIADAQAAILAVIVSGLVALMTFFLGRVSFRVLAVSTAALLLTMPALIGGLLHSVANKEGLSLPLSFQSRIDTYDYVSDKISEKWLTGWGVEASRSWDETKKVSVGDMVVDYRIVPGHPHNMGLQIWAETGLIGALLMSISILLFGNRLYKSGEGDNDRLLMCASAALWGGALVFALVSYKVWNDAYWTAILFLSSGLIAARTSKAA